MFATRLRCVSIAPFARPSCRPCTGGTRRRRREARAARYGSARAARERVAVVDRARRCATAARAAARASRRSSRSRLRPAAGDRRSATRSRACSLRVRQRVLARCARSSRARRSPARRCRRADARARGTVYIGFTFTTTRPARRMPNSATGDCSVFGSITATRSPLLDARQRLQERRERAARRLDLGEGQRRAEVRERGRVGEARRSSPRAARRATRSGRDRSPRALRGGYARQPGLVRHCASSSMPVREHAPDVGEHDLLAGGVRMDAVVPA